MGTCRSRPKGKDEAKPKPGSLGPDFPLSLTPEPSPPPRAGPQLPECTDPHTDWQVPEVQALQERILKNEDLSQVESVRLIRALAYKAAARIESDDVNVARFDENDAVAAYTALFVQCTTNASRTEADMYGVCTKLWDEYLNDVVAPRLNTPASHAEKLVKLSKAYKDFLHINKMVWSKQLFSYLDRFYTPKRKLPTTLLVGYQTFRRIIFSGETSDVKDSLLGLIHDDREGSIVDRPQIKNVIQIFIDCGLRQTSSPGVRNDSVVQPQVELTLDVYKQDFEQDFMSATTEYYMNKSRTWVEQDTFPDYLLKAEQIYNDEEKRRRDFLHESSERALLRIVDTVLVGEYQEALLANRDTGLQTLLTRYDATNGRRTEDLERVYRMFKRLEENEHSGVLPVARMCEQHFLKIGTQIITENSRCLSLDANGHMLWAANGKPRVTDNIGVIIDQLCDKYKLYSDLVERVFCNDPAFMRALKSAFVKIMAQNIVTAPEYTDQEGVLHSAKEEIIEVRLSDKFASLLFSKMPDENVLSAIQLCVSLFGHCSQKDAFIEYHTIHLSYRLLVYRGVNLDWEHQTVSWLQALVGGRMVANMAIMLADMQSQHNLDNEWVNASEYNHQGNVNGIKTSVKVLTYGKWPSYRESSQIQLHPALANCFDLHGQWYRSKRPKTHLFPVYGLSTVELSLYFVGSRKKICLMNIPMSSILMLFAEDPNLVFTVKKLKELVGYLSQDVDNDLYELTRNKDVSKNLLRHEQQNKKIRGFADSDQIGVNDCYRAQPAIKIDFTKLPVIDDQVQDDVNKQILKKRQHTIDACLVRIAKREGKLKKQQFLAKVIKELSAFFPCPPAVVDMCMEKLITGQDHAADGVLLKYNQNTMEYEYNADGN